MVPATSAANRRLRKGALAIVIGLRTLAPKLPGYLIAVAVLKLPVDTIGSLFPDITAGLPMPSVPEISLKRARLGRSSGKLLYTPNHEKALATAATIVEET